MRVEALEGVARDHERRRSRYALIATVLFVGLALWAVVHLAMGGRYAQLSAATAMVVDALLALVWSASAVATGTRWSGIALVPVVGGAATIVHGLFMSVSTPWSGLPFLVIGIALTYAVLRALPLLRRPTPTSVRRRSSRDGAVLHARTPH